MVDAVALLDRLPDSLRRFAYRIANGQGFLGRVADAARFPFSENDVPQLPPLSEAAVRLFVGPTNSAGQAYLWSRAVERHLTQVEAFSMHGTGASPFLPEVDLRVPVAVYQRSSAWHDALEFYLEQQTHVMWESGLPLLGRRYGSDIAREIARLGDSGVRGALLFHGSDIRPPSLHASQSAWSPFRDASGPLRTLEENATKNAALATACGLPMFVSTPDLLRWLPEAIWCPVVVDASHWRPTGEPPRSVPIVAHAPSQNWLKGTGRIEPMLRQLTEEGVIEYRQVVGVPHASMPAFYAGADVVLDQFALGSYGVAACEAMASGRLVVGHVDEFTRGVVRKQTGLVLPIHEATVDSLESELRRVAAEPQAFDALRKAGPVFVEAVHGGYRSAAALAPFLGLSA